MNQETQLRSIMMENSTRKPTPIVETAGKLIYSSITIEDRIILLDRYYPIPTTMKDCKTKTMISFKL